MAVSKKSSPPIWADRFLGWFCRGDLLEEIKGDLHELYEIDWADEPVWKCQWYYWYHVLHFLRPFTLKRKRQNSNTVMITSYFKFAFRNMRKHRFSALVHVLSLGVGIACFLFIFIYLKQEVSYDKFHKDAGSIHRIAIDFITQTGDRIYDATTPPALAPALKSDFPEVVSSVRLFPNWGSKFLFDVEGKKFYEEGFLRTDSTFFDIFTFKSIHGNLETALDAPDQMVLTESTAIKYFGRTDVVGGTVRMSDDDESITYRISAVIEDVPANSHFKFTHLGRITFENLTGNWGWYNYYTYIKLNEGTLMSEFEPALQPFYESKLEEAERYNIIYSQPLTDIHLKSHLKWELEANGDITSVYILTGLGIFILLISCLNYVNLTIAESLKRFKEVGVRKAFGAQKKSIIQQFIVETLMITLLSFAVGLLLTEALFIGLGDLLGREITLFVPDNLQVAGLLSLVVALLAVLAGYYPALHIAKFKAILAVRGVVNRSGKSALGLRQALLVIQFAISAFMIFGTITVNRQLKHIRNVDKGFDVDQVMIIENADAIANRDAFKTELLTKVGVKSGSPSSGVVGGLNWTTSVGYPNSLLMNYLAVDPDFMETLGLELVAGRNFEASRETDRQGFNMIVNETAFKELGLDLEKDVGRTIPMYRRSDSTIVDGTILGVVKDFHFTDFKLEIKPFAFFYRERSMSYFSLKLDTQNIQETLSQIEEVWRSFSNDAPMEYFFLDQQFAEHHAEENRLSQIMRYLTLLAFFIAFIGMFSIANLTIKDKKKEIAIRKVLGASIAGITNLVTGKFLILVVISNAIAIPVSYYFMNEWLKGFAYRTDLSWETFLAAIGSTLVVAMGIVGVQSLKAALGNPITSLRQD